MRQVMEEESSCDAFAFAVGNMASNPYRMALVTWAVISLLTFVVSTVTKNYSQVDKLWSILPCVYAWMVVIDTRTFVMACLTTVWGVRLTWNFYRRGGYTFPRIWEGDEDYRWEHLRQGRFIPILAHPLVWTIFNLTFVSLYQNFLLLSLAAPSFAVRAAIDDIACSVRPFQLLGLDGLASLLFLFFVVVEAIADNQQYAFQTQKQIHRQTQINTATASNDPHSNSDANNPNQQYQDGFCQSGLFSILRKPNYAAEQAIWISYHLFSVSAAGGGIRNNLANPSAVGCLQLVLLFHFSGRLTEGITLRKYPNYRHYMDRVPRYLPFLYRRSRDNSTADKMD